MNRPDPWYRSLIVIRAGAILAGLVLLVAGARASAAGEAPLAFHLGPVETDGAVLGEVAVRLDGRELHVRLPAGPASTEPIAEVSADLGRHAVDVEVRLDGHNDIFTYVDQYRFSMRGHLDLPLHRGYVTTVRVGVLRNAGMFRRWEDRYRLTLEATSLRSALAGAVEPPVPDPAPVRDAPPARDRRPAATCTLAPVGFAFDRADLTREARRALDTFAACLGTSSRAVRVEGHCDLRGSTVYNPLLGQRRADAVVTYLRQRGATEVRFSSRSWGASRPLCTEDTKACHARNRRVEAVLED
jgi:outer membrane protein OmpA-like peptidoglycan-associated protein